MRSIRATLIKSAVILAALCAIQTVSRGAQAEHKPATLHFTSQQQAYAAAKAFAIVSHGSLVLTSGTASMEPVIHGRVYVVVEMAPYDLIVKRDILVYDGRLSSDSSRREAILHRAVEHDRYGWLMSGDNNRRSESWDRVTPSNYRGRAVALFEFPQV